VFTILDNLCYNGWFKIDDSQTASWSVIAAPGSAGWIDINDSQTPSWGAIDTSQPCS